MRPRSRLRSSFCELVTFSWVYLSSALSFSHSARTMSAMCFEFAAASLCREPMSCLNSLSSLSCPKCASQGRTWLRAGPPRTLSPPGWPS